MTKADVVSKIADRTGIEKNIVQTTIEYFIDLVQESLIKGENLSFRGFGSFDVKYRNQKLGRNIKKKTPIIIPAHYIPVFKPSKQFADNVKRKLK